MSNKSGAGALFISTKTKRACLCLRAADKTHSLTWGLWGGMIEGDETPKQAMIRETLEEMGRVPDITRIYPFDVYESKDKSFRYYTFVCIVDEEFEPTINSESAGYAWVKLGEWPKPMHQGAKASLCTKKALALLKIILENHQV